MPNPCEIVEGTATATSSTPATEMIVVASNSASSTSGLVLGFSLSLVSGGAAADVVTPTQFALLLDSAQSTSVASPTAVVTKIQVSSGVALDTTVAVFNIDVTESGASTNTLISDTEVAPLVSSGSGTDTSTPSTVATTSLTSEAVGASYTQIGLYEFHTNAASGVSTTTQRLDVAALGTSTGEATDSVLSASALVSLPVLISAATATSVVTNNLVASSEAYDTGFGSSSTLFRNPATIAWVMNTETTAASVYDNYDFESAAQTPNGLIAVGPNGVYLLEGTTDEGAAIKARMTTGFYDFGAPQTKRMDNMYFGYTSGGRLLATVETYGHAPRSYNMEQRDAAVTPRNNRLTPGKGMSGRYWRVTVENIAGAEFTVHDMTVDLAVSNRRI